MCVSECLFSCMCVDFTVVCVHACVLLRSTVCIITFNPSQLEQSKVENQMANASIFVLIRKII